MHELFEIPRILEVNIASKIFMKHLTFDVRVIFEKKEK